MKNKIISHARAVYADEVRPGSVFDVVTTTSDTVIADENYTGYTTHVVAFDELSQQDKWSILMSTSRQPTEAQGLEELVRKLQRKLSEMLV